jgi:hypothetical protein
MHADRSRMGPPNGFWIGLIASLCATALWAVITGVFDDTSLFPPGAISASPRASAPASAPTSSLSPHPLDPAVISLQDVEDADERGSGWTDVSKNQTIRFSEDEICGRTARPLPGLERAVAYERGISQYVIEDLGRFPRHRAEAYFQDLVKTIESCSSWKVEEFGTTFSKDVRLRSVPPLGDRAIGMTLTAETSLPVYQIDNVYILRGKFVANVAHLTLIAEPEHALTVAMAEAAVARLIQFD